MAVNYERIGKRIQQLRKLKKLSQADLAEYTGMSVSYISHIETGIKHASASGWKKRFPQRKGSCFVSTVPFKLRGSLP